MGYSKLVLDAETKKRVIRLAFDCYIDGVNAGIGAHDKKWFDERLPVLLRKYKVR